MRKADMDLVDQLASSDEQTRVAAAAKLDQLEERHFYDHRLITLGASHPWVTKLVAASRESSSPRVRSWAAQLLALMNAPTAEAAVVVASEAAADGDYAEDIVRHVCTYRRWVPQLDDVLRVMQKHPSADVRARLALHLAGSSELSQPDRRPLIHALMRDPSTRPRDHAVRALEHMPELESDDVGALLDVVALEAGGTRSRAASLLAKRPNGPGRDTVDHFARQAALRFDGIYAATRYELDVDGEWSNWECLRFHADGRVEAIRLGPLDPAINGLRGRMPPVVAWGKVTHDGARLAFALEGPRFHVAYDGVIDGHLLLLTRTDRVTGEVDETQYAHVHVDWDERLTPERQARLERDDAREAKRQAGLAKKRIPFPVPPPKSMLSSEVSRWYKQMTARLPTLVARHETPRERIQAAWEAKHQMRDVAAASLLDPALKKEFLATMDIPDRESLLAMNEGGAMARLLAFTKAQQCIYPRTSSDELTIRYWDGTRVWVMAESGWVLANTPDEMRKPPAL